jgi:hypothetical protein
LLLRLLAISLALSMLMLPQWGVVLWRNRRSDSSPASVLSLLLSLPLSLPALSQKSVAPLASVFVIRWFLLLLRPLAISRVLAGHGHGGAVVVELELDMMVSVFSFVVELELDMVVWVFSSVMVWWMVELELDMSITMCPSLSLLDALPALS